MSHIDIFETYEGLLESGIPEAQAKAHVRALDNAMEKVATKADLTFAIKILEKDLKIFFGYLVGGTIIIAVLIPIVLKFFGLM